MKRWVIVVIALLVLVLVGAGVLGWWFFKRPLSVFAWQTRRTLGAVGLAKVTVDSPAGKQMVFTGGEGPMVVLLHGLSDQAGTWFRVVGDLAKDHTLVVPDLAGHGESAPEAGPIDTADIYAGLEAVVEHFAAEEQVTLVGNSLGGWMAMVMAHRHPERVARVILVNGGAITGNVNQSRLLPKNRAEARETMAILRDPGSPPVPGFVLDDVVRQAKTGPLARFAATVATMDRWVLDGRLGEIAVPVELLWGESDRLMPLDYAQRMLAELQQARMTAIPRCGHVPQVECPTALLAALKPLLGGSP